MGTSANVTATRTTLSDEWQQLRQRCDWMAAPTMAEYVNGLVSGRPLSANGHWAIHANEKHVAPMRDRLGDSLTMLSLACGDGHIEASLIGQFGWRVTDFTGLEYDDALRASAARRFTSLPCRSRFAFFDFNGKGYPDEQFDIVFACHSIHHATDLEGMLKQINRMLKPDGLFIGIDYFGPTRFQIEYDVLPIIEELFLLLPSALRRNLGNPAMGIEDKFEAVTFDEVRQADPSESIRSSDLRTLLLSNFPVLELKPMGGTLLRWLLQYRAGNFDHSNPDHVTILRLLQFIEREFVAMRRIRSDDLFFVLGKSSRLPG